MPFSFDKVTGGPAVAGKVMSGSLASVRCRAAPSSIGTGKSAGNLVGSCAPGTSLIAVSRISVPVVTPALAPADLGVCHEFHQRAVRIAEIDAGAGALGTEALHRPALDGNAAALQMGNGVSDRAAPFKTQVAVARRDRNASHLRRAHARSMHVELFVAEAIGVAGRARYQFGAHTVV